MASQNEIANRCLDLIGEDSISDISDTTERATRIRNNWDLTRDLLLRGHGWNFAKVRRSLAADTSAPAWGFAVQYTLPGDCVRAFKVDQYYPPVILSDMVGADTAAYRIEGGKILTDITAPLKVILIVNSIDVGSWDPCFAAVMACDLADLFSTRATGSETIKARIKAERRNALTLAVRTNAIENPPAKLQDGPWIAAHQSV